MEFTEVVRKRRMIRHFTSEPVAPEVIDRMLDLARHAPSAGFTQGQSFIVVTRPDLRKEIGRLCGEEEYVSSGFHPFVSEAPVLVIPCTSEAAYHRRYQQPDKLKEDGTEIEWPVPYWHMDIGCSVMILLLAAVDEGLSAGYFLLCVLCSRPATPSPPMISAATMILRDMRLAARFMLLTASSR